MSAQRVRRVLVALATLLIVVGVGLACIASSISLIGEIVGDPLAREKQFGAVVVGLGTALAGVVLGLTVWALRRWARVDH